MPISKTFKVIAKDLSKQKTCDSDQKAKQKINFTGNLDEDWKATMFFLIEEGKDIILNL